MDHLQLIPREGKCTRELLLAKKNQIAVEECEEHNVFECVIH